MNYLEIQKNEKQFLAVTSLKVEEFKYLLYHFGPEWEKHYRSYKLDGSRRKILTRKEHGNSVLQERLFRKKGYITAPPLKTR